MGMPPQQPPYYRPTRAQWKAQRAQWKAQAKAQRAAFRARYRMYSRGSLVGPLLLIGIGVVALLMTLHRIDAAYFWAWYGHWWPLILVGAGVVLLIESMTFSRYARIRLGGGVVLLGIILAIIGVAAAHHEINWSAVGDQLDIHGNNLNLAQMFGDEHDATETVDHLLPVNATVVIQNGRGDVTIAAAKDSGSTNQMQLVLNKRVYTNSDDQANQKLHMLEPLITSAGDVVTVHMPSSDSQVADMSITLPAAIGVQVRTGHGTVSVNGRKGPVAVDSGNGDVQLNSIAGTVQTTMHQGDFSANGIQGNLTVTGRMNDVTLSQISGSSSMDGDFFGDVHLDNLHGPVHFHSSRTDIQIAHLPGTVSIDDGDLTVDNATGPVSISTHDMDIEVHRVTGAVQVGNSDGGVDVRALNPIGAMNIQNRSGSVEITLPSDAKFSVDATAVGGDVHSDFDLATQRNNGDHSTISGSVGGGGPLLHITTESGDITLHKGAASGGQ